jgi:hypothetical protein
MCVCCRRTCVEQIGRVWQVHRLVRCVTDHLLIEVVSVESDKEQQENGQMNTAFHDPEKKNIVVRQWRE